MCLWQYAKWVCLNCAKATVNRSHNNKGTNDFILIGWGFWYQHINVLMWICKKDLYCAKPINSFILLWTYNFILFQWAQRWGLGISTYLICLYGNVQKRFSVYCAKPTNNAQKLQICFREGGGWGWLDGCWACRGEWAKYKCLDWVLSLNRIRNWDCQFWDCGGNWISFGVNCCHWLWASNDKLSRIWNWNQWRKFAGRFWDAINVIYQSGYFISSSESLWAIHPLPTPT